MLYVSLLRDGIGSTTEFGQWRRLAISAQSLAAYVLCKSSEYFNFGVSPASFVCKEPQEW